MKRTNLWFALLAAALLPAGCQTSPNGPAGDGASTADAGDSDPADGRIISLFDGQTLGRWKPTDFGGQEAEVRIEDDVLILPMGNDMTGVTWTGEPPARMNYEIALEAKRVAGDDFFCGLTFPVGQSYCSLIVGGWAGSVTGISCLDYLDAANNETTTVMTYANDKWYPVRVRITEGRIQAWISEERIVNVSTKDRHISVRGEVEGSIPMGIATWRTTGAIRDLRLIKLSEAEIRAAAEEEDHGF